LLDKFRGVIGDLLAGRVAVVTGAGRGIGRSLALALADQGALVVGSARTASDLDELVLSAEQRGGQARAVVADASDPEGAREPVRVARRDYGGVDILVNNVGGRVGPFATGSDGDPYLLDDETFGYVLALNLMSGWWTTSAALPLMRERGYGRIVNIGSGLSKRAGRSVPYTAAKHGVVGMTVALAASCGVDGITVNCLCPGWTRTSHNDWAEVGKRMGGISPEQAHQRAASENAQRRVLEPDELAPMAILLASPAGAGITGQVISVDGGWHL
jgi:NAD(P)-dependent dehydrogenase (short-subunit alcohol dehydrogenase family)